MKKSHPILLGLIIVSVLVGIFFIALYLVYPKNVAKTTSLQIIPEYSLEIIFIDSISKMPLSNVTIPHITISSSVYCLVAPCDSSGLYNDVQTNAEGVVVIARPTLENSAGYYTIEVDLGNKRRVTQKLLPETVQPQKIGPPKRTYQKSVTIPITL